MQARRVGAGQVDTRTAVAGQDDQLIFVGDVAQTRRNHREMGVENRALWVVPKISGNEVTWANTTDSADSCTISRDYVASSLQLGYASTVHWIQGETTDVAVVGPDVDAGGLNVGMTRGRRHNEVVLTAAAEEPARAELVEMMRRGHIEATLEDAREAARSELGRAACTPAQLEESPSTQPTAPWTHRKRRPVGTVMNMNRSLSEAVERQRKRHKQLATVVDQLTRDRRTLVEVEARLSTHDARNHQARADGGIAVRTKSLQTVKTRLEQRVQAVVDLRAKLSKEYTVGSPIG